MPFRFQFFLIEATPLINLRGGASDSLERIGKAQPFRTEGGKAAKPNHDSGVTLTIEGAQRYSTDFLGTDHLVFFAALLRLVDPDFVPSFLRFFSTFLWAAAVICATRSACVSRLP